MKTATHLASSSCLKANIRTTALLALCALASASAVAGSQTGAAPVTRTAKVSLADLDLSTPEGARAALQRLHQTARRLCAQVADSLDLSHQPNFVKCVDDTLAAALKKAQGLDAASAPPVQTKAIAASGHQPPPVIPYSRTSKVSLADLDLTTPEGTSAARERLRQEARRLCNQVADSLDLSHQSNFVACVDETLANALRQGVGPALVAGAVVASAPPASHP
jgi:UrcA family protein